MIRPGKDGLLDLEILSTGPGSRRIRAPLSLGRILHADPSFPDAHVVYIRATGGGLAQGDHVKQRVQVRSDAHAVVTSQSATRVHSMTSGYAEQITEFTVEPDAVLEYLPDPAIPSRDCRFRQHTKVSVSPGATAIVGDCFIAGRVAHGELHDAAEIDFRAELYAGDSVPAFIERAQFLGKRDLTSSIAHGTYPAWASLWVVCSQSLIDDVLTSWQDYPRGDNSPLVGASTLPDGLGVWARFMGNSIEHVTVAQHEYWDRARRIVLGAPAFSLRKM